MSKSPFDDDSFDETDLKILWFLQQDARNATFDGIAEQMSVSGGTVRNRIREMEEAGYIEGYVPLIDYEAAGAPLRMLFTCTAPIDARADLVEEALAVRGVISVREFTASRGNVRVVGLAEGTDDITRLSQELTDLGLTVDNETLMRQERIQPMNHFGEDRSGDTEPTS